MNSYPTLEPDHAAWRNEDRTTLQFSVQNDNSPGGKRLDPEQLRRLCRFPLYALLRRQGLAPAQAAERTRGLLAATRSTAGARVHGRLRIQLRTLAVTIAPAAGCWGTSAEVDGDPTEADAFGEAEVRLAREAGDPELTPEEAYDQHWARGAVIEAITCLRAEYAEVGAADRLELLGPFVWGGSPEPSQADAAERLALTEHAFVVTVHRLRRRLRNHLRAVVAQTVADPAEVDREVRFLLAVVRRRPVAVCGAAPESRGAGSGD